MGEESRDKLPHGWNWATIGELIGSDGVFTDGDWIESKDQDPAGEVRLVQLADVGDGIYRDRSARFLTMTKARELGCTFLEPSDVLIARMPDPLGRACIFPGDAKPCVTVVDVAIVRTGASGVNPKWLMHFINAAPFRSEVARLQSGSTRARVSRGNLAQLRLPVPPLAEQARIVEVIETQFAWLAAGEAALERVRVNVERYRSAVLQSAFDGRLVPRSVQWPVRKLRDLTSKIGSGSTPRGGEAIYQSAGVPLIRSLNVHSTGFRYDGLAYISDTEAKRLDNVKVEAGDVLLTITGASIGRVTTVPPALSGARVNQHVCIIRPTSELLPSFVAFYLASPSQQSKISHVQVGATRPALTKGMIVDWEVPVPALDTQMNLIAEIERRLAPVDALELETVSNLMRARRLRASILYRAYTGDLVLQDHDETPANILLHQLVREREQGMSRSTGNRRSRGSRKETEPMGTPKAKRDLEQALARIGPNATPLQLFTQAGFGRDEVYEFYDALSGSPKILPLLAGSSREAPHAGAGHMDGHAAETAQARGPFRLHELWIEKFKNLEDYLVTFNRDHALDVLLGWNGTGKSNLFEVLITIFRDLYLWQAKKGWKPSDLLTGYRIRYETGGKLFEIAWSAKMRRPQAKVCVRYKPNAAKTIFSRCDRDDVLLPHFVFGYYSGPGNRFSDLFSELKQDHYDRLLKSTSDDGETLARLLADRRFFCAETHHAKYALLAFFYQDEPSIQQFLKQHLRIEGLESVLFVLKRPRWYRNNDPEDFWGAGGLLRPVLERLRRYSDACMVIPQRVDDGYQESTRDHYFLFLPDKERLQAYASHYRDASSFFVALESADFSSIIHEVRIRIRIKATASTETVITFRDMSEGEQQLLMVLGLLRFTKVKRSLVLLDEPDTHLNPHWQLNYLHLLLDALVGSASSGQGNSKKLPIEILERRLGSQVLLSTHDPLAIAGLLKENIHLLKRKDPSEECIAESAAEDPRGLGFTGILTSEMFGLRSDLDEVTLSLLDEHVQLAGREKLTDAQRKKLDKITRTVESLGFKSSSSDPYYRAFLQGLHRRREARKLFLQPTLAARDRAQLAAETDAILAEIDEEESRA